MTQYVLRATNSHGQVFFYTGKAGEGWISPAIADAFLYKGRPTRKAMMFNVNEPLHHLWFIALELPTDRPWRNLEA